MSTVIRRWVRKVSVACIAAMVSLGCIPAAHATVVVAAGTATGIGNDWDAFINGVIIFGEGAPTNNVIHVKLDLGMPLPVGKIININRTNATTMLNARAANIRVAADESLLTFNPNNPADYTITVFDGEFQPAVFTIGVAREADFGTGWYRRYFLINYTSNFVGSIDGTANRDRVHLGGLEIVMVPEPSMLLLLGAGGILIGGWRRRRADQRG